MSAVVLKYVDEDGAPFLTTHPDVQINISSFVPGTARELGASFSIPPLPANATLETETSLRGSTSTGAGYLRLALVDEDGAPFLSAHNLNVTIQTPVDTTPPAYTTGPAPENIQLTGADSRATMSEACRRYGVAVRVGSGMPGPDQVRLGQQSDGLSGYASNFKDVASGVSEVLTLAGVLYEGDGVTRITQFDFYEYAADARPNLSEVKFVGTITIDAPAAFAGNTVGTVNATAHQVTLGPYAPAVDTYDTADQITYIAYRDAVGDPVEVAVSAPGDTSITFDPGDAGTGAHDYLVRARNTRGLVDANTAKVRLTLPALYGAYTIATGVLKNNANIPLADGTTVIYSIYNFGDTRSPHTESPTIGNLTGITLGGKLTFPYNVSGTHWVRVTDLLGNECWSGKVVVA